MENEIVVVGSGFNAQSSILPLMLMHGIVAIKAPETKKEQIELSHKYELNAPIQYEYFPLPPNYITGKTLPKRKNRP